MDILKGRREVRLAMWTQPSLLYGNLLVVDTTQWRLNEPRVSCSAIVAQLAVGMYGEITRRELWNKREKSEARAAFRCLTG
jgi:hypothetical protein